MKHEPPKHLANGFNCPHCDAFAEQTWAKTLMVHPSPSAQPGGSTGFVENLTVSFCRHCKDWSLWKNGNMIYPAETTAPLAADDTPETTRGVYDEARTVLPHSPAASAALLRKAIEILVLDLDEGGKGNLNGRIGNLVKRGLPIRVQKAMDSLRVVGNNAVHPGQIDLDEDPHVAVLLFDLFNLVVEKIITDEKKIDGIFESLPEGARQAIDERDGG